MDPNTLALIMGAAGAGGGEKIYVEDVFSTWLYTGTGATQTITNGIDLGNGFSITPGTALAGGYFAGFISHTADGVATHALIVAPAATGASGTGYTITTNLQWKTTNTTTAGTTSSFNGAANSANMNNASHPAAQFCENLSIGGYTDWYLPARLELDIAYENLKPGTTSNSTSWGINPYSVPERTVNRTAGAPAQTSIAAFQTGGAEAFVAGLHWSSTEFSFSGALRLDFSVGSHSDFAKESPPLPVRAFRKIPINDPLLTAYAVTGKGGLTWIKGRSGATGHRFTDTARGATKSLDSSSTAVEATESTGLTAFNSTGFTIGADTDYNTNAATYASWTFRKAPKFFDVVTWTGNGAASRAIAHNLGSQPGFITCKRTDSTTSWPCAHRGNGTTGIVGMLLNDTGQGYSWSPYNTYITSTTFDPTQLSGSFNVNGATYVAYLFAHDAGGFGDSGNDSVVSCGTFTTDASANFTVNLGWEPQWVMWKRTDTTGNWEMFDTMRGFNVSTSGTNVLRANLTNAETSPYGSVGPTSTGFKTYDTVTVPPSATYIYIAIRRGPMKTPTDATKVFSAALGTSSTPGFSSGFPLDLVIAGYRNGNGQLSVDRVRGSGKLLTTSSTSAESSSISAAFKLDYQNGCFDGSAGSWGSIHVGWMFRRAPGFFDVVAYTWSGAPTVYSHNLGANPELVILKTRSSTGNWFVYSSTLGFSNRVQLNTTDAVINSGFVNAVSSSTLSITLPFSSGTTFIAYLFATCPGVSKVGSYTGTGTTLQINCGFTAGARFVMIKRTDSTGDWYVWDTARGIVSGNDSYLLLNSTAAEVTNTDYIDPLSSGFEISSTAPAAINANGGTYIYLSVA